MEELHIQQFIDWGIDFIKLDECYYKENGCEQCWDEALLENTYRKWRRILDEKGSDIVLGICAYSYRDWNPEVGVMSRSTFDIGFGKNIAFNNTGRTNFLSVLDVADQNNENAEHAGNGFWNDPDMLLMGHKGPEDAATITLQWDDVGLKGRKLLRDVFENEDLGHYRNSASFELCPNSCRFLRIK